MLYSATIGGGESTVKEDKQMNPPERTKGLSFQNFMGAMKMMSNE